MSEMAALRSLLKSPATTLLALLTLALGIGANTAIFSVLEAVLLRPLPYPEGDRLLLIWQRSDREEHSVSWPNYLDWRAQAKSFRELGVYARRSLPLTGRGAAPEMLSVTLASANWFAVTGLPPVLGRGFSPAEDAVGAERVVVISHRLWQERFAGRPDVLGQTVQIDAVPHLVVGVLAPEAGYPFTSDAWVPIAPHSDNPVWADRSNNPGLNVLARLAPGVSVAAAQAEMRAVSEALAKLYPDRLERIRAVGVPLPEFFARDYQLGLWAVAGAAGAILLIACANVGALQLVRGVGRAREFAVRAALGAGRGRLMRLVLGESLLLALVGGAAGTWLAFLSFDAIRALAPTGVRAFQQLSLNATVLGFSLLAATLTGVLCGLWPAWSAGRVDLRSALQSSAGGSVAPGAGRIRRWLVGGQVALGFAVLAAAGMLLSSLHKMERENLGFEAGGVLSFRVSLPAATYGSEAARFNQFYDELRARLAELPGVRSVAANLAPPLRPNWQSGFHREDQPEPAPSARPSMELGFIDGDYFRTLGIPILRGRSFTGAEGPEDLRGIVIDQAFADRHFPGEDPLGKRIVLGTGWSKNPELQRATVIGVVPTLRFYGAATEPRLVQAYLSRRQIAIRDTTLLLKCEGDPRALSAAVARTVAQIDPNLPIAQVRTMQEVVDATFVSARMFSTLVTAFAVLAFGLAILGLAGLVSYAVAVRRREIGIRLALGASARQAVGLVMSDSLRVVALALVAGLGLTLLAGRLLAGLLFRVSAHDPVLVGGAALGFALAAWLACWLAARRAAGIAPSEAMRSE